MNVTDPITGERWNIDPKTLEVTPVLMNGAEQITAERRRQVDQEGWSPSHDATHSHGELLRAAIAYLEAAYGQGVGREVTSRPPMGWPFGEMWWKPSDATRNLVKAGALIAAEIDRLQRLPRCVYRVQIEPGVWLAPGYGDPPRALDSANAAVFASMIEAEAAMAEARIYRPFANAVIESAIAPLGGK